MYLSSMNVRNYLYAVGVGGLLLNAGCLNADPISFQNTDSVTEEDAELELTAFSGEGHNGPDLEGPAAPISLDRSVEPKEILAATTYCHTQLMKQVYKQFFRRNWTDEKILEAKSKIIPVAGETAGIGEDGKPRTYIASFSGVVANRQGSKVIFKATGGNLLSDGIRIRQFSGGRHETTTGLFVTLEPAAGDLPGVASGLVFGQPWGIPAFRYERKLSDFVYDDLGTLISFKENVTDIHFSPINKSEDVNGESMVVDGPNMPFYRVKKLNLGTPDMNYDVVTFDGPTKVTFDAPAFRNCLNGKLDQ